MFPTRHIFGYGLLSILGFSALATSPHALMMRQTTSLPPISYHHKGCAEVLELLGLAEANSQALKVALIQTLESGDQLINLHYQDQSTLFPADLRDLPWEIGWGPNNPRIIRVQEQRFVRASEIPRDGRNHSEGLHAYQIAKFASVKFEEGYYVLVPERVFSAPALRSDLVHLQTRHGVTLVSLSPSAEDAFVRDRFLLFSPAIFLATFQPSLAAGPSPWALASTFWTQPMASPVSDGVVRTRGGGYYIFRGGTVRYFDTLGNVSDGLILDDPAAWDPRHAAIMKRQGVVPLSDDPYMMATQLAERNAGLIAEHLRQRGVGPALAERWGAELNDLEARLTSENGEVAPANTAVIRDAVESVGDHFDSELPSLLQWQKPEDAARSRGRAISIVRPFIWIRGVEKIRFIHDDAIHYQTTHAHFGHLTKHFAEKNLFAGGLVELKFDPLSHQLLEIQFVRNGFFNPVTRVLCALTSTEVELATQQIQSAFRR